MDFDLLAFYFNIECVSYNITDYATIFEEKRDNLQYFKGLRGKGSLSPSTLAHSIVHSFVHYVLSRYSKYRANNEATVNINRTTRFGHIAHAPIRRKT